MIPKLSLNAAKPYHVPEQRASSSHENKLATLSFLGLNRTYRNIPTTIYLHSKLPSKCIVSGRQKEQKTGNSWGEGCDKSSSEKLRSLVVETPWVEAYYG